MKLSKKQREDLESALYYAPSNCLFEEVTDRDIERYFAWSDRGIGKQEIENHIGQENQTKAGRPIPYSGFSKLYYGKRNRELMITMYLEDWSDTMNAWSFKEEPEPIKAFLRRAMKKAIL